MFLIVDFDHLKVYFNVVFFLIFCVVAYQVN
jgi:hypothetical protein